MAAEPDTINTKTMERTQIFLTHEQRKKFKQYAEEVDMSMAAMIRIVLDVYIAKRNGDNSSWTM